MYHRQILIWWEKVPIPSLEKLSIGEIIQILHFLGLRKNLWKECLESLPPSSWRHFWTCDYGVTSLHWCHEGKDCDTWRWGGKDGCDVGAGIVFKRRLDGTYRVFVLTCWNDGVRARYPHYVRPPLNITNVMHPMGNEPPHDMICSVWPFGGKFKNRKWPLLNWKKPLVTYVLYIFICYYCICNEIYCKNIIITLYTILYIYKTYCDNF